MKTRLIGMTFAGLLAAVPRAGAQQADAPVPPPTAPATEAPPGGLTLRTGPVTAPRAALLDPQIRLGIYQEDSKSPLAAATLEFLTPIPGLGQTYAGTEWWRIAIQYGFLLVPIIVGLPFGANGIAFMTLVGIVAAKTWGVYDAVRAAHAFNAHLKIQLGLVPRTWPIEERW
jgi:hypothetical protein